MKMKFLVTATLQKDKSVASEVGCATLVSANRQVSQLRMLYGDAIAVKVKKVPA